MERSYTNIASLVDNLRERYFAYDILTERIATLLSNHIVGKRLLSLGCGTGNLEIRLAQKGFQIIGVDKDEQSLIYAKQRFIEAEIKASFVHQDFFSSLADMSECDVVLLMYPTLTFLEIVKLKENITKLLPKNGLFLFNLYFFDVDSDAEEKMYMDYFPEKEKDIYCLSKYTRSASSVNGFEIYMIQRELKKGFSIEIDKTYIPVSSNSQMELKKKINSLSDNSWSFVSMYSLDGDCPESAPPYCKQNLILIRKKGL